MPIRKHQLAALFAAGAAWCAGAQSGSAQDARAQPSAPPAPPGPVPATAPVAATMPEAVVQVDLSPAAGVFSLWLNNGIRVHIRPMPGSGRVCVAATVVGGEVLETRATRGLSQAAANSWARVDSVPDVQITRSLMPEGLWVRAVAPTVLASGAARQIGAMLSRPAIDPARLEGWKGQARVALDRRGRAARTVALEAVQATLLPADRRPVTVDSRAQIDEITPLAAQQWLEECVRTHPIEIAMTGDLTLAQGVCMATEHFAERADHEGTRGLPARERPAPAALRGIRDLRDAVRLEGIARTALTCTPEEGTPARTLVALAFRGPEMSELNTLRAANVLADCAAARATPRLQEAGFPTATVRGEIVPGRAYLGTSVLLLSASLAPTTEGGAAGEETEALAVLRRALGELATLGPGQEELAELVMGRMKEAGVRLAEPEYWSSVLSFADCNGVPVGELGRVGDVHRAFTPQSLKATLAQLVRGHGSIEVIIRPVPEAAKR